MPPQTHAISLVSRYREGRCTMSERFENNIILTCKERIVRRSQHLFRPPIQWQARHDFLTRRALEPLAEFPNGVAIMVVQLFATVANDYTITCTR